MRVVEISREPVELFKILKFEGLVGSGGEAKMVIADGLVLLNGKVETRKRKKMLARQMRYLSLPKQIGWNLPLMLRG